jgi:diaminohydroxyphosphoribosylaminopyrimidine deaminase / 5-amino-6-(5-phosphoribosylamino)uracil reductase
MTDDEWRDILLAKDGDISGNRTAPQDRTGSIELYRTMARQAGPFVLAQVGQSLDGRVATPAGDAKDVSGTDGIAHLHRCRALVDVVIVGVGTVVADDPSLSVRAVSGDSPVRAVIDCNARMPLDAKMLGDGGTPVLVIQADDTDPHRTGHETILLPRLPAGGLDPAAMLAALAHRGLVKVLVEGGAATIARFIEAGLVDRLHVSVAPVIIGSGPSGINLPPIERLSDARRPPVDVYNIGTDIIFDCDLRPASTTEASASRKKVAMADMA